MFCKFFTMLFDALKLFYLLIKIFKECLILFIQKVLIIITRI